MTEELAVFECKQGMGECDSCLTHSGSELMSLAQASLTALSD